VANLSECSVQEWKEMTSIGKEAYLSNLEPVKSFMQRVVKGVNEALSQPGPVLIVAHGGIHWAMCCYMNVEHEWAIGNCIPVHFTLGEDGQWRAKKLIAEHSDYET
jgi:probable phosphoglycerate mutase